MQSRCLFSRIKSSSFQGENLPFVKGGGSPSLRLNQMLIYGGRVEERSEALERAAEAGALRVWGHPGTPAGIAQTRVNRPQILKRALSRVSCSLRSGIANIRVNMYGSTSQTALPCPDLPTPSVPEVTHPPTTHPFPRIWPKFGVKLP